jgi:membrane-bound serine protease (ClpP class)
MTWLVVVALLFAVGLLLLCIEVLVIPGFGAVGVLGVVCLVASGGLAWWKLGVTEGLAAFLLAGAAVGALLWYLPRSAAGKALILTEVQSGAATRPADVEVGAEGIAATALRPAGVVQFAHREVDVVSEGLFVDVGSRVRVTRVEGSRVFVEPVSNYQGG